jgi:hypothetical protein
LPEDITKITIYPPLRSSELGRILAGDVKDGKQKEHYKNRLLKKPLKAFGIYGTILLGWLLLQAIHVDRQEEQLS